MDGKIEVILVDDDEISNLISSLTVEMILGKGSVRQSFTKAAAALEYLQSFTPGKADSATILLLDLNMPLMTGWEFLERFDQLSTLIKERVYIHILSSSVDNRDKERSYANKNVVSFLVKPLTKEVVLEISKQALK